MVSYLKDRTGALAAVSAGASGRVSMAAPESVGSCAMLGDDQDVIEGGRAEAAELRKFKGRRAPSPDCAAGKSGQP
ncbi:hypothetical protein VI817_007554 [Penicillium citrinum]|nr:hypothetical protein VI817_007554 [Penicillium citrinum]